MAPAWNQYGSPGVSGRWFVGIWDTSLGAGFASAGNAVTFPVRIMLVGNESSVSAQTKLKRPAFPRWLLVLKSSAHGLVLRKPLISLARGPIVNKRVSGSFLQVYDIATGLTLIMCSPLHLHRMAGESGPVEVYDSILRDRTRDPCSSALVASLRNNLVTLSTRKIVPSPNCFAQNHCHKRNVLGKVGDSVHLLPDRRG